MVCDACGGGRGGRVRDGLWLALVTGVMDAGACGCAASGASNLGISLVLPELCGDAAVTGRCSDPVL
jgi:hypothetical protein